MWPRLFTGNVALAFCAFSCDGRLNLVVTADARALEDVDALTLGMEQRGPSPACERRGRPGCWGLFEAPTRDCGVAYIKVA